MVRFLDMEKQSDVGVAIEGLEEQVTALHIEEGFRWDHGYHLGPRCPRCRPYIGEARMDRGRRRQDNLREWNKRKETHHG